MCLCMCFVSAFKYTRFVFNATQRKWICFWTISRLHWDLKILNKGLIVWKRFIYREINQPMELSFKGTKDISMRKTVGLHFLHILKGFRCPFPTVKARPHSRAWPELITGTDHCWSITAIIDHLYSPRPTSSSRNDSFGSITRPQNLNTYLKGLKKFTFELGKCSSDQPCPGRGIKGLGGLGLHTFEFWGILANTLGQ